MFFILLFAVLSIIVTIFYISKRKNHYWKEKDIPYAKPVAIFGNYYGYITLREYIGHVAQNICKNFPDAPYIGTFYGTKPALLVQDLDMIKLMLTKDFYFFNSREVAEYTTKESLTQNMFFTYGDRWKALRQNSTALFSSGKMKNMFFLIENCARVFETLLDQEIKGSDVLEVRKLLSKYTINCIGSCVFGIDTECMEKSENNPFIKMGQLVMEVSYIRGIKSLTRAIWPNIFYGLGFRVFPKRIDDFFIELLTNIFRERHYKPTTRNDFVDLLLKLKLNNYISADRLSDKKTEGGNKVEIEVDDRLLIGQCVLFFAAGFETSSTTLSFTLYELAKNPDVQERALEEVDKYMRLHNNELKYECVADSPYLEACIDEALRLYPVFGVLTREVVEDYTLPTGLKLEKGLRIHIPTYHLHYNPDYFPEPKEYRPDRFFGENKRNIKPYSYIPFGEGPRICIGMRFAKMQMMAGLITLLKKFRVELAEGMEREIQFSPTAMVTQPMGGIRLKFVKREGWEQRVLKTSSL